MSCPICNQESEKKFRPFCSKRCADIDLGRWMTGAYAVPTDEAPEMSDAGTDQSPHDKKLH